MVQVAIVILLLPIFGWITCSNCSFQEFHQNEMRINDEKPWKRTRGFGSWEFIPEVDIKRGIHGQWRYVNVSGRVNSHKWMNYYKGDPPEKYVMLTRREIVDRKVTQPGANLEYVRMTKTDPRGRD